MMPSQSETTRAVVVKICNVGHVTVALGGVSLHLTIDEFFGMADAISRAAAALSAAPPTQRSH